MLPTHVPVLRVSGFGIMCGEANNKDERGGDGGAKKEKGIQMNTTPDHSHLYNERIRMLASSLLHTGTNKIAMYSSSRLKKTEKVGRNTHHDYFVTPYIKMNMFGYSWETGLQREN